MLLELGDRCDAVLVRGFLADEKTLAVVSRRVVEPGYIELVGILLFNLVIDLLGIGDRILLQDRDQAGAGILRVQIDVVTDQAGVNQRGGDIEGPLHLIAGVFEG